MYTILKHLLHRHKHRHKIYNTECVFAKMEKNFLLSNKIHINFDHIFIFSSLLNRLQKMTEKAALHTHTGWLVGQCHYTTIIHHIWWSDGWNAEHWGITRVQVKRSIVYSNAYTHRINENMQCSLCYRHTHRLTGDMFFLFRVENRMKIFCEDVVSACARALPVNFAVYCRYTFTTSHYCIQVYVD